MGFSSLSSLRSFCLKFSHLVPCTTTRRNQGYSALHHKVPLLRNRCFLHNVHTENMEVFLKAELLLKLLLSVFFSKKISKTVSYLRPPPPICLVMSTLIRLSDKRCLKGTVNVTRTVQLRGWPFLE